MTEAPKYHTKTLSPLSPLPVHLPEPSTIPVLQNQMDPVFNMTSTHIAQLPSMTAPTDSASGSVPITSADGDSSPANSSFSDAYKDNTVGVNGKQNGAVKESTTEVADDDYAMEFDSDGDEHSDSLAVAQANVETDTIPPSTSLSVADLSSIPTSNGNHALDAQHTQTNSSFSFPTARAEAPQAPQPEATTAISYEGAANDEGVDIQALLDTITANAEAASSLNTPNSATPTSSTFPRGLPAHASLPPRPEIPRVGFRDNTPKYTTTASSFCTSIHSYPPPPGVQSLPARAPGTSIDPRAALPPPPSASFTQSGLSSSSSSLTQPSNLPSDSRKAVPASKSNIETYQAHLDDPTNVKWPPEINKQYDRFLIEEQGYVQSGQWGDFPQGARLFIGNLASEKVTKRDIYHVFHKYGRLAQIAIKNAYAFVQFHDARACLNAIKHEQGTTVRGKPLELQVSKSAKTSKNPNFRSRSPDTYVPPQQKDVRTRPGSGRPARRDGLRQDQYGRDLPPADIYSSRRSSTPPRNDYRRRSDSGFSHARNDSGGGRGDSYHPRDRQRSRSRSPYRSRDNGRYRDRSPSPRRAPQYAAPQYPEQRVPQVALPHDPPTLLDIRLIIMENLDPNFVSWVVSELTTKGLKADVLILGPRDNLETLIERQVIGGVHAVSLVNLRSQNLSQIPLRVFKRQPDSTDVQYDEYADLDPKVAGDVVLNTKNTFQQISPASTRQQQPQFVPHQQPQFVPQRPLQQPAYAPQPHIPQQATYNQQPAYQQHPTAAVAKPDLSTAINQMDNLALQKLLSQLSAPQQQNQIQNVPAVAANSTINLANLLGQLQPQKPVQQQQQVPVQPQPQYQVQPPAAQYNAYPAVTPAATSPTAPQQQNVQNILAQLARFRK